MALDVVQNTADPWRWLLVAHLDVAEVRKWLVIDRGEDTLNTARLTLNVRPVIAQSHCGERVSFTPTPGRVVPQWV